MARTITTSHIEDFLGSLRGGKNAPANVRTMRTYLAEIYRVFTHLRGLKRPCAGSKQWVTPLAISGDVALDGVDLASRLGESADLEDGAVVQQDRGRRAAPC